MVILKSLFLAGLLLSSAFANETKPLMAALQVQSNFDFSLTHKEFRVHYSGLGFTTSEPADIKIFKKNPEAESQEFHTFRVDDLKKNEKKAYYFALEHAEDGEYEVEVCAGSICSGKTPALTDITSSQPMKLTCEKGKKDFSKEFETWIPSSEEISLDFKGPVVSDWITNPDTEFTAIEDELNNAIKLADPKSKTKYETDYKRLNLRANPTYERKTFYAALKYDVAQYKALFDKYRGEREERTEYAHDKCKRKYLLSAHAHLVDSNTKEVKYRFKTTLHLSGAGKQYFILGPGADTRKVHVEMTHENVDIDDGTYKIHIIFCATQKDAIESTFCAPPVIYNGAELMVYNEE